jgi:acetolactate synthase-1/2/3 large subunit
MKLSDYVAFFFASIGIKHAFVVSGGASLHLIHGVEKTEGITYVCCHHEQAAAMAADGYYRVTGRPGLAITSSGPGATNLLTGICGCYYDSIPAFFITGQVVTFRMSLDKNVRQVGFQETPIVEITRPITKYSVQINDPNQIKYELQKAYFLATNGRPGPVLIDIPDDIQRMEVDIEMIPQYLHNNQEAPSLDDLSNICTEILSRLAKSKRPILIAGWGVYLAGCKKQFITLVDKLNIPVALTWGASDLLPADHPLRIGTFGTHGTRFANFAVQNADFILSIGSRLDTKATGSPPNTFARGAWRAVNDISLAELNKFSDYGLDINCLIHANASDLISVLIPRAHNASCQAWKACIEEWKKKYTVIKEQRFSGSLVDPYIFFDLLCDYIPDKVNIFSDTGSTIAWLMQAFRPREHHRVWHDYNNTAMGWALPASIAAALADPSTSTFCIVGDGSFMMNLQELQTLITQGLNIKIICLNNNGYSMIQQTQDQWLDSKYIASSPNGGVGIPNFCAVCEAFGIQASRVSSNQELPDKLKWLASSNNPSFLLVNIDSLCRVTPQVKFGRPNEDPEPLLDRSIFYNEMIIKPLK